MRKRLLTLISCMSLAACQTSFEQSAGLVAQTAIVDDTGSAVGQARVFERDAIRTINIAVYPALPGTYRVLLVPETGTQDLQLPDLTVSEEGIGAMSDRLPANLSGPVAIRVGERLVSRIELPVP